MLGNKIDRPEAISEGGLRGAFALDGQVTGKVSMSGSQTYGRIRSFFLLKSSLFYQQGNIPRKDLNARPLEVFMCSVLKRQGYGEGFRWLSQYID